MVRIAQYRLDNIKSMYGSKLGSLFKAYVMKAIEEGADLKKALTYAEKRVKEEAGKQKGKSDSKDSKSKKEGSKKSDKGDSKESEEGSDSDGEDGEGSDGESGDGEGGSEGGE